VSDFRLQAYCNANFCLRNSKGNSLASTWRLSAGDVRKAPLEGPYSQCSILNGLKHLEIRFTRRSVSNATIVKFGSYMRSIKLQQGVSITTESLI